MRACPKCGRQNPDLVEWCPGCGTIAPVQITIPAIPVEAQIEALISGKVDDLVAAALGVNTDAIPGDVRRYLTIERKHMISFFQVHRHIAEGYLIPHPSKRPFHDVLCIEKREGQFEVALI